MSEQRLIDANAFEAYDCKTDGCAYEGNEFFAYVSGMQRVLEDIDAMPTIDPETLPIVRELREKLERVTAELDAAVSDLENIMAYNSDTCKLCKNRQCYVRGGTKPCLPKWRGLDGDHS